MADAIVFTEGRLREMGLQGPASPFLVVVLNDDDTETKWFSTIEELAAWCRQAKPKTLFTRTTGIDFDCDELARLCRGRVPAILH